jgi:ribosomal protein S18 acetylase RimI-like enzyme
MSEIIIKAIDQSNEQALRLPNEAFHSSGKLVVTRTANGWQHEEFIFESPERQLFPDENYQLEQINRSGFAIGAFEEDACIGIAILEKQWNHYLYLSDLKVVQAHRRKGVSSMLLDKAIEIAKTEQLKGLSTIAQDNNLTANRFYLKYGFEIGGLNTKDYQFTNQRDKCDIYYYFDF